MTRARVTKSTGSWYTVTTDDGRKLKARTIGKMRLNALKTTNPIAVGDFVIIDIDKNDDTATIQEVEDRRNYVIRQSPRKKHYLHILASNLDQAFLIVTIIEPKLKQGFIDRFLLMTEPFNIPVHIIFNKCDVYGEEEMAVYRYLKDIYEDIGYQVHLASAIDKTGIETLKHALKDKTTLISGQSGVGKSSIINTLDDNLEIKTTELSDYTGKGQHTTTFAEMHELVEGGAIIDTPGIKTLSFNYLELADVAHNFKEFFQASSECKFSDCLHRNEPNCAIKEKIEQGLISELRYFNYCQILEEIEDQNYWELHN